MITHALQEWAVVCEGLGEGRLLLTARKGGIHERGGGLFTPEHQRFALIPTYLHQAPERLQPTYAAEVARLTPPPAGILRVHLWAEVARVWKVQELLAVQALGPELPWTPGELAVRFAYRDQPHLYVVALRVQRFPKPIDLPDDPSYAGCRSWVPLTAPLDPSGSVPVVGTGEFGIRTARINTALGKPRSIIP